MGSIAQNLAKIQEEISNACLHAGREPNAVKLIAISKKKSAEAILDAYQSGQRDFGENYVQEFLAKKRDPLLAQCQINWHFTGHLQSNKIKSVIDQVSMIQTIDKLSTAEAVSKRAEQAGLTMPILMEVNISNEYSKSGFEPEEVLSAADSISELPHVELHGLMTIGSPDLSVVGMEFYHMRKLLEEVAKNSSNPENVCELSMGMSQDYDIAIQEGATMVRIGTSIFGAR